MGRERIVIVNTGANQKEPFGLPPGTVRAVLFLILGFATAAQAVLDDSERSLVIAGAIPVAYSALKGLAWLGKVLAASNTPRALTGEADSPTVVYPETPATAQAEDAYTMMRREEHQAQLVIAREDALLKAAQRREIESRLPLPYAGEYVEKKTTAVAPPAFGGGAVVGSGTVVNPA